MSKTPWYGLLMLSVSHLKFTESLVKLLKDSRSFLCNSIGSINKIEVLSKSGPCPSWKWRLKTKIRLIKLSTTPILTPILCWNVWLKKKIKSRFWWCRFQILFWNQLIFPITLVVQFFKNLLKFYKVKTILKKVLVDFT